ncbi:MAG: hypothetical protein AAGF12_33740 [Myxococcota bacterium]
MTARQLTRTEEFLTLEFEGLYVVRWFVPVPPPAGLDTILREVEPLARERSLAYCGISDERLGTPKDDAHKKRLVQVSLEVAEIVDEFHIVLPGTSAQAMLARSMYRGMVVGARLSGKILHFAAAKVAHKLHVHRSVPDVAKHASRRMRCSPSELMHALDSAGALDGMGQRDRITSHP